MRVHKLLIAFFCLLPLLSDAQSGRRRSPGSTEPGAAAVLPFQIYENHIVIPVTVSGSSDTLHFIFDSGSEVTVLHYGLMQKLGIKSTQKSGVSATGNVMLSINTATLNVLYLDQARLPFLKVYLENIPEFRKGPLVIDGFIGIDLLQQYTVKIDYAQKQLVLYRANPPQNLPTGALRLPFTLNFRTPVISAAFQLPNGTTLVGNYHIISGGDYGVLLNWPYVEQNKLDKLLPKESTDEVPELLKINIYTNSTIPFLTIGNRRLSQVPVSYCEDVKDDSPVLEIAGSIGYEVWKRFPAIIINYRQKEIILFP